MRNPDQAQIVTGEGRGFREGIELFNAKIIGVGVTYSMNVLLKNAYMTTTGSENEIVTTSQVEPVILSIECSGENAVPLTLEADSTLRLPTDPVELDGKPVEVEFASNVASKWSAVIMSQFAVSKIDNIPGLDQAPSIADTVDPMKDEDLQEIYDFLDESAS